MKLPAVQACLGAAAVAVLVYVGVLIARLATTVARVRRMQVGRAGLSITSLRTLSNLGIIVHKSRQSVAGPIHEQRATAHGARKARVGQLAMPACVKRSLSPTCQALRL